MEALVGLRAAVQHKKQLQQEEQAAVHAEHRRLKLKTGDSAAVNEPSVKNTGVEERDSRDREQIEKDRQTEDSVRAALERKAALYDKLQGGVAVLEDDQLNSAFLVNFQKKIVDAVLEQKERRSQLEDDKSKDTTPAAKAKEENQDDWVEYVDALGRTREVRRREVAELEQQDRYLRGEAEEEKTQATPGTTDDAVDMAQERFEDHYRQQQRQRWQQKEEENAVKQDVHYDDVMFEEARTHGVGFVRLSGDSAVREQQQQLLRDLHTSSAQAAAQHRAQLRARDRGMAQRLDRIRQRKRLKKGLPMTRDAQEGRMRTPPPGEDDTDGEEDEESEREKKERTAAEIAEQKAEAVQRRKAGGLRAWDVGKQIMAGMVEPADKDPEAFAGYKNPLGGTMELSQEAWLDRQRSERNNDFAPPSAYEKNNPKGGMSNFNKRSAGSMMDTSNESASSRYREEDRLQRKYNDKRRCTSSSFKGQDIVNECDAEIDSTSNNSFTSRGNKSGSHYNSSFRLDDDGPSSSFSSYSSSKKSTGTAIPPPATFEYYGPCDKKRPREQLFDPMRSMEEAISKGLKKLKEQT